MAKTSRQTLQLIIAGSSKEAQKAAKELGKGLDRAEKKTQSFMSRHKGLMIGMAAAGVAAVAAIRSVIKAAEKQEAVERKLAAAMKISGTYSQGAFQSLVDYAAGLQKITRFGDEAIIEGESLLATFGAQGDTLKKATKASLDLAEATGIDVRTAFNLMGRAVAGNTSMLSRYGIIVDQNELKSKGFNAVLEVMDKRFGGMSEKMGTTFQARAERLKNAFGDLKEQLGFLIIKSRGTGRLLGWLTKVIQWATRQVPKLPVAVRFMYRAVKLFIETMVKNTRDDLKQWAALFVAAYDDILSSVAWFGKNFLNVFTNIWEGGKTVLANFGKNAEMFFGWLWAKIKTFGKADVKLQWTGLFEGFEAEWEKFKGFKLDDQLKVFFEDGLKKSAVIRKKYKALWRKMREEMAAAGKRGAPEAAPAAPVLGGADTEAAKKAAKKVKELNASLLQDYKQMTMSKMALLDDWYRKQLAEGADELILDKIYHEKRVAIEKEAQEARKKALKEGYARIKEMLKEHLFADQALRQSFEEGDMARFAAILDDKRAALRADLQARQDLMHVYEQMQMESHRRIYSYVAEGASWAYGQVSGAVSDVLTGTRSWAAAVKELGKSLVKMVVDWIVQRGIAYALGKVLQKTMLAHSMLVASATARAWAPAAAMASLATFGANAPPAMAGIASTTALASALAIPKMAEGGIITRPTVILAGEKGREAILPLDRGMERAVNVNIQFYGDIRAEADTEEFFSEVGRRISNAIKGNI